MSRPSGPPRATYRLQISVALPMTAAADLVPYLRDLGISHLYASPLMQARRGSTHGYDVVDPTRFDEERGGETGFAALSAALDENGLGLLLDVVPNHAAATVENPWWRDVLARGRASPHAAAFDVDWEAPGLDGKILVPLLDEPYGEALANGTIRLVLRARDESASDVDDDSAARGAFEVVYHEHRLPLSPETAAEVTANGVEAYSGEEGREQLDALLARQHYRLAFWRLAGERLDYRRFFDVHDLVGLRVEVPEVFDAVHARLLELRRDGNVQGLRIDHVDGLRRPGEYLRRLRAALHEVDSAECYVAVEKILAAGEELPPDWSCHGTTGYDFDNEAAALFVDPAGFAALDRFWRDATGARQRFPDLRYARKKQVLAKLFGAEISRLARKLLALAAEDRVARDLPPRSLVGALIEVTACLPVYRTYVDEDGPGEADRERLLFACREAKRRGNELADPVLPLAVGFLRRVLLLAPPAYLADRRPRWLDFVHDWQQATGAVMAKGHEDTALYVHARLISLNEVGGEPPGVAPPGDADAFHRVNGRRRALWPATMNATSTHDTKRSEDAGCRISVLSEMPETWEALAGRWLAANARLQRRLPDGRLAPDANEQLFLYQTLLGAWLLGAWLLGAWPLDDSAPDDDFGERIAAYLRKALREAKTHSSWLQPDEAYEEAVLGFAADLLRDEPANEFLLAFRELAETVAAFGAWSSLAQVVLKVASPGVPDFYQGTELWDLSLADPDNRRPVDFGRRREALEDLRHRHDASAGERSALLKELLASWHDGRVKLYTTWRALAARAADPQLFLAGDYQPVRPQGTRARHLVAFARAHAGRWLLAVVPRWTSALVCAGATPIGPTSWADTWLPLPAEAPSAWQDAFTGARVRIHADPEGPRLAAGIALASYPVALLLGRDTP